jgi:phosphoribosylaminoimidazole-succinocarboxamide synthase
MSDELVNQISERYIELFENITGDKFVKGDVAFAGKRIENNILQFIAKKS